MQIINNKTVVKEKMSKLKGGYSAYVETIEVANLVKKEIRALQLNVHEDITEKGFWFIPLKSE